MKCSRLKVMKMDVNKLDAASRAFYQEMADELGISLEYFVNGGL